MIARLTGQYTAHLCAAGNIRAMPENEIPPAGGLFLYVITYLFKYSQRVESGVSLMRNFSLHSSTRIIQTFVGFTSGQ